MVFMIFFDGININVRCIGVEGITLHLLVDVSKFKFYEEEI